jgi:predicted N-acetyltransferase YhbS
MIGSRTSRIVRRGAHTASVETTDVRPATAADIPRIRAIVEAAYSPYIERIGMRPGPMHDDQAQQVADGLVHVAERGGEVVGLIVLSPQADHLLIENVAVAPAVRGTGVGRLLLQFAERQGFAELRLYTHVKMTENQALYARNGYVETHRDDVRAFFTKRLA